MVYRWFMVGFGWLFLFTAYLSFFAVAPLMRLIIKDLGLTYATASFLSSTPCLVLAVFSLVGGAIIDKLGVRRGVGLAVLLVAVFGLLRGFALNFLMFLTATVGFGVGVTLTLLSVPKLIAVLNLPREKLGSAIGLSFTGITLGVAVAMSLTLGIAELSSIGWRQPLYIYGVFSLFITFLWWSLTKEKTFKPQNVDVEKVKLKTLVSEVIKLKPLWFLAVYLFLLNMSFYGVFTWFPEFLQVKGVSSQTAALMLFMANVGGTVAMLFLPLWSDRIGLRKPILAFSAMLLASGIYLLILTAEPVVWLPVLLVGAFVQTIQLALTIPIEIREIGPTLASSANGFICSIGYIGGFIAPWIVGFFRDLTGSFTLGFLVLTVTTLMMFIPIILLPETGWKKRF